jgi:hypothetical protein
MKQRMSVKNEAKISGLIGELVLEAWTRGGWTHYVAEVWTATRRLFVNYREGRINWEEPLP